MKIQIILIILCAVCLPVFADKTEAQRVEEKVQEQKREDIRQEQQRVEQRIQDRKLEDQRLENKRQDDRAWDRAHGR
ncbi:MAG: hypothetical protein LLG04_14315 [Parachlamydia sp.]|nr:hypothetical protein [Parachlamydia sp.]